MDDSEEKSGCVYFQIIKNLTDIAMTECRPKDS